MPNPWLHRYTILLAVCTLFLVVAGASVTSNQAGLSVPDWPLSYGKLMPEMRGGVFFEHGHRLVATTVGFLTIILSVWLWRADPRRWMKKLGLWALAGVIVQGVLGGLTVILLLPPAVSVAHACLAQLFFSATVALALFTSKRWFSGPVYVKDMGWPSLRSMAIVAPVAVLAQIALGAAFRHGAMSVIPHLLGAVIVAMILLMEGAFILHQFPENPNLAPYAKAVLAMTFIQIFLGVGAFMARMSSTAPAAEMLMTTVAHVAGGGLTLAFTILLSIQIRRQVLPQTADVPAVAA